MAISTDILREHLVALHSSLVETRWMTYVEAPVLAVFDELLAAAQRLAPDQQVLRAIKRPSKNVKPGMLLALVDQMLVTVRG